MQDILSERILPLTHTHVTSASVYSTWLWAKSPISICKTHVSPMKHTPLSCLLTKKYSQGPGNLSSATFKHTVNINKQLQNNRICVVHHQVRLNCFFFNININHLHLYIHIYIYIFIYFKTDRHISHEWQHDEVVSGWSSPGLPTTRTRRLGRSLAFGPAIPALVHAAAVAGARVALLVGGWRLNG